jgi:tRNA(His) 5'-end guanylyltransferase
VDRCMMVVRVDGLAEVSINERGDLQSPHRENFPSLLCGRCHELVRADAYYSAH